MPRGLSLAREANRLLVWTEAHWLFWTNRDGQRQAQTHFPSPIIAAVSEDGSAFVVAEADGRISWLAADLQKRWEHDLKDKPTAVAVDPLGMVAAIATKHGQLVFIHADGQHAGQFVCPRPAHHLVFVPGTTTLIASADLGWIAGFDLQRRDWIWRDAPVVSIADLAVAGDGEPVLLACYSEGMRVYQRGGQPVQSPIANLACRSIALTYDGSLLVSVGLDGAVNGTGIDGSPRFVHRIEQIPVAIALSSFGETVYIAHADRRITALNLIQAP